MAERIVRAVLTVWVGLWVVGLLAGLVAGIWSLCAYGHGWVVLGLLGRGKECILTALACIPRGFCDPALKVKLIKGIYSYVKYIK